MKPLLDVSNVCPTAAHEALKADLVEFRMLTFIGVVDVFGDGTECFECRNCACGSTLYRQSTLAEITALVVTNLPPSPGVVALREAGAL